MHARTAVHYNPSSLHNHHHHHHHRHHNDEIRPPTVDHILWQEKANEYIKHAHKQTYKNDTKQRVKRRELPFSRHSTGGNNSGSGVLYTHPSAIAMMTLNKRASQGDLPKGRGEINELILPENNGLVGNELLTARQRHLRDLFSGDLGIPPVPPPLPPPPAAPPALAEIANSRQRTHVGNVVHTFETLAMQRRLATFKQHEQQPQLGIKNAFEKRLQQQNTFSKYLNRYTTTSKRKELEQPTTTTTTTTTTNNNNFSTKISSSTTFNERNKQISQRFLQQMEIDYRKNLFTKQSHVNNNNNKNNMHKFNNELLKGTISEGDGEAGVVAKFDEMLAGYSTTTAAEDDDDDDDEDDDILLENNARVSIININRNEAQNNVLHINLSRTNGTATANVTDTYAEIKQLKSSNTNQGFLPITRKKPAAPLPPPKPQTKKLKTATTQQHKSCNNMLSEHHNKITTKCAVDVNVDVESNEFLRGTTLSQSFVCHSNWQQQQRKKPKAPKPPILPITTPIVQKMTKNKQIKTNTCIAITNPFRHVLRL